MLFYFACEAAGASAPGIPHALLMERRKDQCTTRAHSRRENAEACVALKRMPIDVVIASAAKQSSFLLNLTMDCFAALAMTLKQFAATATHHPSSPRTRGPITTGSSFAADAI